MDKRNKVFIERAEPLTPEGIKAICMPDKDYDKYKLSQEIRKQTTQKVLEIIRNGCHCKNKDILIKRIEEIK